MTVKSGAVDLSTSDLRCIIVKKRCPLRSTRVIDSLVLKLIELKSKIERVLFQHALTADLPELKFTTNGFKHTMLNASHRIPVFGAVEFAATAGIKTQKIFVARYSGFEFYVTSSSSWLFCNAWALLISTDTADVNLDMKHDVLSVQLDNTNENEAPPSRAPLEDEALEDEAVVAAELAVVSEEVKVNAYYYEPVMSKITDPSHVLPCRSLDGINVEGMGTSAATHKKLELVRKELSDQLVQMDLLVPTRTGDESNMKQKIPKELRHILG